MAEHVWVKIQSWHLTTDPTKLTLCGRNPRNGLHPDAAPVVLKEAPWESKTCETCFRIWERRK